MAWAFAQVAAMRALTPAEKLVLLKLADRADPQGVCWPGHERTASDLKIGESTVRGAIARLHKVHGLLWIERDKDEDGRDKPNKYHLHLDLNPRVPDSGTRPMKSSTREPRAAPEPKSSKSKSKSSSTHTHGREVRVQVVDAAAPKGPRERKRERLHALTGIVYWYSDEPEMIERDVQELGLEAIRAVVQEFRHLGKAPLRSLVVEAVRKKQRTRTQAEQYARDRAAGAQPSHGDPVEAALALIANCRAVGFEPQPELLRVAGLLP